MRSKVQLDNIKAALFPGFLGLLLSDQDVEVFANEIQKRFDDIHYAWEVRIRLSGDKRPWESISVETVEPIATLEKMRKSYRDILSRYPQIEEVQITESQSKLDVYVIARGDKE